MSRIKQMKEREEGRKNRGVFAEGEPGSGRGEKSYLFGGRKKKEKGGPWGPVTGAGLFFWGGNGAPLEMGECS